MAAPFDGHTLGAGDCRAGAADRYRDPPHPCRRGIPRSQSQREFRVWITGQVSYRLREEARRSSPMTAAALNQVTWPIQRADLFQNGNGAGNAETGGTPLQELSGVNLDALAAPMERGCCRDLCSVRLAWCYSHPVVIGFAKYKIAFPFAPSRSLILMCSATLSAIGVDQINFRLARGGGGSGSLLLGRANRSGLIRRFFFWGWNI
jgi:hypothetical protein